MTRSIDVGRIRTHRCLQHACITCCRPAQARRAHDHTSLTDTYCINNRPLKPHRRIVGYRPVHFRKWNQRTQSWRWKLATSEPGPNVPQCALRLTACTHVQADTNEISTTCSQKTIRLSCPSPACEQNPRSTLGQLSTIIMLDRGGYCSSLGAFWWVYSSVIAPVSPTSVILNLINPTAVTTVTPARAARAIR